ncbi:putative cytochrome P450 [Lupinus albus]|uniref:Putative cytochrome P450 n=1 Tax=Lupinus albus TaxID=3870 RepID=A0A6A4QUY6_LUPAL|nr:putative cytochrome P450 [Lupinus albus]
MKCYIYIYSPLSSKKLLTYYPFIFSHMDTWFTITVSLCLIFLLRVLLSLLQKSSTTKINNPFPPGPTHIPIITPIIWLTKSVSQIEAILKNLHTKYGPIVTLRIGSRPSIYINDRSLAHQILIQNGSVFSDRPITLPSEKILTSNQHNINSCSYGTTWRILRRNLIAEMLHPSRVKSFAQTRKWVLDVLLKRLKSDIKSSASIKVVDHFQHAMSLLFVFMCFGQRVDDEILNNIEITERTLALSLKRFVVLNFWPRITKFLFRKRWEELLKVRNNLEMALVPLIRARKEAMQSGLCNDDNNNPRAYVDTLLDLKLPNEGQRNLDEGEMVTLCSEFLNAGI